MTTLHTDPEKAADDYIARCWPQLNKPEQAAARKMLADVFITGMLHLGSIAMLAATREEAAPALSETLDNLAAWAMRRLNDKAAPVPQPTAQPTAQPAKDTEILAQKVEKILRQNVSQN